MVYHLLFLNKRAVETHVECREFFCILVVVLRGHIHPVMVVQTAVCVEKEHTLKNQGKLHNTVWCANQNVHKCTQVVRRPPYDSRLVQQLSVTQPETAAADVP